MFDAELLDRVYYHNTVRTWLIGIAVMAGVIVVLATLRRIFLGRLERLAAKTRTHADDLAVDLVRRTKPAFRLYLAMLAGSLVLDFPPDESPPGRILKALSVLALVYQVSIWGNGVIEFLTRRQLARSAADGASATTITALSYGARMVLYLVLFLVALDSFGINITALVAGLGIGGIAVALAVQNILGDLFGALSIVLDKPFVVGDFIIVDQYMGTVEHIGLKTTRVRALGGEQIVMSNGELLRSRIRNYKRMFERRVEFVFTVGYDAPPETVERIPAAVREIVTAEKLARFDRAHLKRFAESGFEFETVYVMTVADYNTMMDVQQAVNLALLRRLQAMGVSLAMPARVVHLHPSARTPASVAPAS
jgi:small-conductance mechanosensitive channel